MTSVVNNYLRWFELNRCKREIRDAGLLREGRRRWRRSLPAGHASPQWSLHSGLFAQRRETQNRFQPQPEYAQLQPCPDPFTWMGQTASNEGLNVEGEPSAPGTTLT